MRFSVQYDDKNKNILILGEGPIQGLDDTTQATKAIYPLNFTKLKKKDLH